MIAVEISVANQLRAIRPSRTRYEQKITKLFHLGCCVLVFMLRYHSVCSMMSILNIMPWRGLEPSMLLPENPHALLEIRNFDLQDCYEEKVSRDTKWVAGYQ